MIGIAITAITAILSTILGIAIAAILSTILGYGICTMSEIAKESDKAMARDIANLIMKSRNKL